MNKLLCIKCQKEVADFTGKINGITTWFAICSECLFNVKGWTRKDFKKLKSSKPQASPSARSDNND